MVDPVYVPDPMTTANILLIHANYATAQKLEQEVLRPAGHEVTAVSDLDAVQLLLRGRPPDLVILGTQINGTEGIELAKRLLQRYPTLPIILLGDRYSEEDAVEAMRCGIVDYLSYPFEPRETQRAVERAIQRSTRLKDWAQFETHRGTQSLRLRVDGLEALQRIGRQVTALLEPDKVLSEVVDAAVELTGAEEGSLLLLDEATGELYMRASRNFQDEFVRTFRLPIHDSVAGQVLKTGKPMLIDTDTPHKIKTAYLVYTLIYVPLVVQGRVIGVLEVDNRKTRRPFSEYHVALVSALADYAAIAIENARLFERTEVERGKLETILTKIDDGVLVVDLDGRIIMVNDKIRSLFGMREGNVGGKPVGEVLHHADLLEVLEEDNRRQSSRTEIALEDGRVFNTQISYIPNFGTAVTMQDITHLKELDRIKSDFVNTVSHDLRSPLTAILGYVELIERVGSINAQQAEFIRRVQISVHNITSLINDLLDLGRIEAGYDTRKEVVHLHPIIQYAADGMLRRIAEKNQELVIEVPLELPPIFGNPVRLRQMIGNLLGNAAKYTQDGGRVTVHAHAEGDQIILQVIDNGPGIPSHDQPYIFDKFYRARNVEADVPGTGLGLAIVKSIVDNHQGRIWVNSRLGEGSNFTIVLPIASENE